MNALFQSSLILGLGWFAAVNAAASVLSWGLASVLPSRHAERGAVLLAIRLFPAAAASLFVSATFLPGHWRFEQGDAQDSFGVVSWTLACTGALLFVRAGWRAITVGLAGRHLGACARLPETAGGHDICELPGLPGVSLAGVLRTRILVGSAARRQLTSAELEVAIAHELAHRGACDNVKRFAMFCAPDIFGASATGRRMEEGWRQAAEWSADAQAVAGDERRAVLLASALVKVARLGSDTPGPSRSPAWCALHDPPLLEARVRRLVGGDALPAHCPMGTGAIVLGAVAGFGALASAAAAAESLHAITEALLQILP